MQSIKRLCLLRLSAIGDVCHGIAMVSAIRDQHPDIAMTWVVGKVEYQLVKHIPNIEFIIFDKKLGLKAYIDLKRKLKHRHFDVLLAMQVALRANIAALLIPATRKIGFDWSRSKEFHRLVINESIEKQTHPHVLDGFFGFAKKALNIQPPKTLQWHLPISDSDATWFASIGKDWGRYIVINPAASNAQRNWLPERYGQVAEHFVKQGFKVVITGGPSNIDRQLCDEIMQYTDQNCIDLVGSTTLIQLVKVLKHAVLVVAPDTGPAHMATMVNTPVVGLYAHSNPRRTGPYLSQDLCVSVYDQVIHDQQGQSWQQVKWGKRAKGDGLMALIEVEAVIQKAEQVLGNLNS